MFMQIVFWILLAVVALACAAGLWLLSKAVYSTLKKPIPGPREPLEFTLPKRSRKSGV